MAENTEISWADDTFNPWIGCMKVGPACDGCYAEARMDTRFGQVAWGGPGKGVGERRRTVPSTWAKPRKWDREALQAINHWVNNPFALEETPRPSRFVFCASLADVFDNAVPAEWRTDLFELIRETPNLTWLLLTKRPQMIVKLFADTLAPTVDKRDAALAEAWPHNAAIGCTVVTQEEADRDIRHLLAAFRTLNPPFAFISDEPSLEHIDLPPDFLALGPRAWAIWGGETDQGKHKARWADPAWARSMQAQCAAAGVPFHVKQMTRKAPVPADLQIQERPTVA